MKLLFLLQFCIFVILKENLFYFMELSLYSFASENKPSFLLDGIQNNLWSGNLLLSSLEDICSKANLRDGCLG